MNALGLIVAALVIGGYWGCGIVFTQKFVGERTWVRNPSPFHVVTMVAFCPIYAPLRRLAAN